MFARVETDSGSSLRENNSSCIVGSFCASSKPRISSIAAIPVMCELLVIKVRFYIIKHKEM